MKNRPERLYPPVWRCQTCGQLSSAREMPRTHYKSYNRNVHEAQPPGLEVLGTRRYDPGRIVWKMLCGPFIDVVQAEIDHALGEPPEEAGQQLGRDAERDAETNNFQTLLMHGLLAEIVRAQLRWGPASAMTPEEREERRRLVDRLTRSARKADLQLTEDTLKPVSRYVHGEISLRHLIERGQARKPRFLREPRFEGMMADLPGQDGERT